MGVMIEGVFHVDDPGPDTQAGGQFQRAKATIRNWITSDGAPGPTGEGGFSPEAGRYHLYAAWNCPWAHRVLLAIALKGLGDQISVAYALPNRTDQGWVYEEDPLFGVAALHEAYARDAALYTGRLTVPLLWDREQNRAVSNESADLVRMIAQAFDGGPDLAPEHLVGEIDAWNAEVYANINNGVYRAGFARTQEAYEAGFWDVFTALDKIEAHLADNRYLCGDVFTEADVRLFPTLARFDVAYHYAFKCNLRRLTEYPNIWAYAREIYQMPGVAETVRFDIYKRGYFSRSDLRNPLGIVPLGPEIDWNLPHGRGEA
ncbi:MAG: glutathione S-transferase C-terminal domain-containing protein [Pseudomonadota bacterium]